MSSQFWSIWLVYYFSFLLLLFRGVGWANQVFRVGPCRGQQLVVVNSSLLVGASQARWPSLLCCPSLRREGESRLFERRNEVNCVNFFVGREKSRRVLTPREKAKDARRSESSMAASLFFFILGMWHTRTCYCSTHTHTRRDLLIISFFSFSDIFCDSFRFDSFSFLFFLPLDMATFSSFPLHHLSLLWMLYGGALLSFFLLLLQPTFHDVYNRHDTTRWLRLDICKLFEEKKTKKKNMLYYNFIWKKMLYNDVQYRLWKDMWRCLSSFSSSLPFSLPLYWREGVEIIQRHPLPLVDCLYMMWFLFFCSPHQLSIRMQTPSQPHFL